MSPSKSESAGSTAPSQFRQNSLTSCSSFTAPGSETENRRGRGRKIPLWSMSRATAWRRIKVLLQQARRSAQILLVSAVADAYMALAADRENLALAENIFKAQESAFAMVQRQFLQGVTNELSLRQAQTSVETALQVRLYAVLGGRCDADIVNG